MIEIVLERLATPLVASFSACTLAALNTLVRVLFSLAQRDGSPEGHIPFSANSRRLLAMALREALRLGHNYVGTEHILLALLELEDGNGVLTGLGIDRAATEVQIAEQLAV